MVRRSEYLLREKSAIPKKGMCKAYDERISLLTVLLNNRDAYDNGQVIFLSNNSRREKLVGLHSHGQSHNI